MFGYKVLGFGSGGGAPPISVDYLVVAVEDPAGQTKVGAAELEDLEPLFLVEQN